MYEGNVQLTMQNCSACGQPTRPRVDRSYDRLTKETIVEANWCCGRCGHRFASGIVDRIQPEKK